MKQSGESPADEAREHSSKFLKMASRLKKKGRGKKRGKKRKGGRQ